MATRQYIGARYVPKFFSGVNGSSEWVSGIQYEALTIVTRLGNGFTSRKPVPSSVGAPEDNPEYWVNTFNFNSQVELLSEHVDEIEDEIVDIQSDIATLDATTIKKSSARKYLFVSDSYGITGNSWVSKLVNIMGLDSSQYDNLSVTGTGFWVSNTNGFLAQITGYTGDRNAVTDIIVAGGLNDSKYALNETSGLVSAITAFCTYAKSEYPNADIYIGYIGAARDDSDLIDGRTIEKRLIARYIYRSVALDNGVNYLAGAERSLIGNTNFMNTDGVHPSDAGYTSIAKNILASLNGGGSEVYPDYAFNFTAVSPFSLGTLYNSRWSIDGNNALINIPDGVTLDVTQGQTLTGGWKKIATFDTIYFDKEMNVPCVLQMNNFNSQSFNIIKSQFKFSGDSLFIRLAEVNDAHTSLIDYVAGSGASISIYTNAIMFDPMLFLS